MLWYRKKTLRSKYGEFEIDVPKDRNSTVEEWQTRPLDAVYPVLYIDAVHFSVREDNITKKLAAYVILGITTDGHKDVISLQVGEVSTTSSASCTKVECLSRKFPDSLV